jgi:hypothetical protein
MSLISISISISIPSNSPFLSRLFPLNLPEPATPAGMDGSSSPLYYVLYILCTVQYLRVKRDIGERDTEKGTTVRKKGRPRREGLGKGMARKEGRGNSP